MMVRQWMASTLQQVGNISSSLATPASSSASASEHSRLVSESLGDLFLELIISGSEVSETLLVFLADDLLVVSSISILMSRLDTEVCFFDLMTSSTRVIIHSVTCLS